MHKLSVVYILSGTIRNIRTGGFFSDVHQLIGLPEIQALPVLD
jgi:hypothetical protein